MDNYDLSHKQADCTCQWHICRFSQSELRHCCSGEKYSSKAFLLSFPALALLSFTFETSSKLGCLCFTFVLREYCAIQFVNQYCLGEKQGKARKVFFEKPPYLLLMRQVLKLGAFVSDFFPEYWEIQCIFQVKSNARKEKYSLKSFPRRPPIFSSWDKFETCCLCCPCSRSTHLQLDPDKNHIVDISTMGMKFLSINSKSLTEVKILLFLSRIIWKISSKPLNKG